jgi:hypothetical protein
MLELVTLASVKFASQDYQSEASAVAPRSEPLNNSESSNNNSKLYIASCVY